MSSLTLTDDDTITIALDISMAMGQTAADGGMTRIAYAAERLKAVTTHTTFAPSLFAFGAECHATPADTTEAFATTLEAYAGALEPLSNTHLAISAAWMEHHASEIPATVLLIVIGSEPYDTFEAVKNIADISRENKDADEFRIAILTVGVRSSSLQVWLDGLGDALAREEAKFDIVHIGRLEDADLTTGALNTTLVHPTPAPVVDESADEETPSPASE